LNNALKLDATADNNLFLVDGDQNFRQATVMAGQPVHFCFTTKPSGVLRARFTLVWNDGVGFVGNPIALTNNLDLMVKRVGANAKTWLGNEQLYKSGEIDM
jgi:hypothetical protein